MTGKCRRCRAELVRLHPPPCLRSSAKEDTPVTAHVLESRNPKGAYTQSHTSGKRIVLITSSRQQAPAIRRLPVFVQGMGAEIDELVQTRKQSSPGREARSIFGHSQAGLPTGIRCHRPNGDPGLINAAALTTICVPVCPARPQPPKMVLENVTAKQDGQTKSSDCERTAV